MERVALEALEREDPQELVAVNEPARAVDRDAPVGVAVEGEADVGPVLDDRLGERRRVGRAAAAVDVVAVGLVVDHRRPGAPVARRISGPTR